MSVSASDLAIEHTKRVFRLTRNDLQEGGSVFKYYYTALALHDALSNLVETNLKDLSFYDNSLFVKAKINMRLLRYAEAIKFLEQDVKKEIQSREEAILIHYLTNLDLCHKLSLLSTAYLKIGNFDQAQHYLNLCTVYKLDISNAMDAQHNSKKEISTVEKHNHAVQLHNLGVINLKNANYEDASTCFEQALEVYLGLYGVNNVFYVDTLTKKAIIHLEKDAKISSIEERKKAEQILFQAKSVAYGIKEKSFELSILKTVINTHLATLNFLGEKKEVAKALYIESMSELSIYFDSSHPYILMLKQHLCLLQDTPKKIISSLSALEKIVKKTQQQELHYQILHNLGNALIEIKEFKTAEIELSKALNVYFDINPESSPLVINNLPIIRELIRAIVRQGNKRFLEGEVVQFERCIRNHEEYSRAMSYYNEFIVEEQQFARTIRTSLFEMCGNSAKNNNQYEEAVEHYVVGYELSTEDKPLFKEKLQHLKGLIQSKKLEEGDQLIAKIEETLNSEERALAKIELHVFNSFKKLQLKVFSDVELCIITDDKESLKNYCIKVLGLDEGDITDMDGGEFYVSLNKNAIKILHTREPEQQSGKAMLLRANMFGIAYEEYYLSAINELLKLRVSSLLENHIILQKAQVMGSTAHTYNTPMVEKYTIVLSPFLVPSMQTVGLMHWVGIACNLEGNVLKIIYLDSENAPMPVMLQSVLSSAIRRDLAVTHDNNFPVIFQQQLVEQQRYNNCGPELIENFVYYLTGTRAIQEGAICLHSLLFENSLLDPIIYKSRIEENNKLIGFLSNTATIAFYYEPTTFISESRIMHNSKNLRSEEITHSLVARNSIEHNFAFHLSDLVLNFVINLADKLDISLRYKKAIYREDIKKLYEVMSGYNFEMSVEEALSEKGFRKLALRLHPDKGGDAEDFKFAKDLKDKFEKDIDVKSLLEAQIQSWLPSLYKASGLFKIADTAIDTIRAYQAPSLANAKQVAIDSLHICSMFSGFSKASIAANILSSSYTYYEDGLYPAIEQGLLSTAFMLLLAMVAGRSPYLGFLYTAGMVGYSGYSVVNNAYSLLQENFGLDETNQNIRELNSCTAYLEASKWLAETTSIKFFVDKYQEYGFKVSALKLDIEKASVKANLETEYGEEFGNKLSEYIHESYSDEGGNIDLVSIGNNGHIVETT